MYIALKNSGNVYEQIVDQFEKFIKIGAFKNGDMIPSCRTLACDLGINPNTVNKAYTKLAEDGFVTAVPKKGYIVSYQCDTKNEELKKQISSMKDSGISFEELEAIIKEVYGK